MPEKKNPNMALWSKVCTTKAEDTKHVNQRGGFTAIDGYSQIAKATEVFGPCGKGWGWSVDYEVIGDLVVASIIFWWMDSSGQRHDFPSVGAAALKSGSRVDHDAHKKAQTDAITKALSFLGFNHDIFRNWGCTARENKYIEDEPQQRAPRQAAAKPPENLEYKAPQANGPRNTGGNAWLSEDFKYGKHKGKTWEWFSQGSEGGERYGYMSWMSNQDPNNGDPKYYDNNVERVRRAKIVMGLIEEGSGEMQDSEVQERGLQPEDVEWTNVDEESLPF